MANYHFVIGIREKIPIKLSGPDYIVTDNSDYTITLEPDAEWDRLEAKTIYYVYDNGTSVQNPIIGNQDTMPIIQTSGNVHIGVSAGELHTTQYLSIPLKPSVRRKAGAGIKPPAPDVYDKIMDMLNELDNRMDKVEEGGSGGGGVVLEDDGEGNIVLRNAAGEMVEIEDDGEGNLVIGGIG